MIVVTERHEWRAAAGATAKEKPAAADFTLAGAVIWPSWINQYGADAPRSSK